MLRHLKGSRGFSVNEILVGFALFGMLVVGAAEGMRLYINTSKYIKIQEQVLDVRAYLRGRLNCENTLTPIIAANQCDGSQYVNLKDGNNVNIVLADESAKIGDYKIRSQCKNLGGFYGITAEYLRTNSAGTTAKDPMTQALATWKSLFPAPLACKTPAPVANLLVNSSNVNITIPYDTAPSVSWTSTNATTCKLTGGPPCNTGSPPAACSQLNHAGLSTGNLIATKTYVLTCNGSATVMKQITITVSPSLCPTTDYPQSGGTMSFEAKCDGKLQISTDGDNVLVLLHKIEGGVQVLAACDDEGVEAWCNGKYPCCDNKIKDNQTLLCSRTNQVVAVVKKENGDRCPPLASFGYKLAIKKGDIVEYRSQKTPYGKMKFTPN